MKERPLTPSWLRQDGFEGFSTIHDIHLHRAVVSPQPGVYAVLREELGPVDFLSKSTGGWFKGRDPSVAADTIAAKWVDEAFVLYIGKADAGARGQRGIRTRLDEYLRFGMGEPIGHWGGRYLWQLARTDELFVCYKACPDPAGEERRLLDLFHSAYGALPYANLRRG
jgi:hypothetical protein